MASVVSERITLAEFLELPETKPSREYIDGQILQKPMPQGKRSALQTELIMTLNGALKRQRRARAFSELRCTFGGRSLVPDLSVFTWERIPRDSQGEIANSFALAPDWTIEILSPGQSQTKVAQNILHCLRHDTQMGWLIDPEEHRVLVYLLDQEPLTVSNPLAILPVPAFAGALPLTVGLIFECLLD